MPAVDGTFGEPFGGDDLTLSFKYAMLGTTSEKSSLALEGLLAMKPFAATLAFAGLARGEAAALLATGFDGVGTFGSLSEGL